MEYEDFEQFSQPNLSPNAAHSLNSSQVHSQTHETQSSSIGDLNQFHNPTMSTNLQYPTFPNNPSNAQNSSQTQQQNIPNYPYQGLQNTPNVIYVAVPTQTPVPTQPPKVSKKRKNPAPDPETISPIIRRWTVDEDIALTNARLYVSSDADVGVGQKSTTMWNRIFQVWKEKMGNFDNSRDSNALECRWGRLHADINKFHGCYERMERLNKSGKTPEDVKRDAQLAYQGDHKNKLFKHLECWEICRKNVKWCTQQLMKQGSSKKKRESVFDTSDDHSTTPNPTQADPSPVSGSSSVPLVVDVDPICVEDQIKKDEGVTRPINGRKAVKDQKKRMVAENVVADALGNLNSSLEKQLELTRVDLEVKKEREKKDYELREKIFYAEIELKEKNQKNKDTEIELKKRSQKMKEKAQKREEQERILDKDLSKLSPFVRQKYEAMQAQIFMEWEKDSRSGEEMSDDDD